MSDPAPDPPPPPPPPAPAASQIDGADLVPALFTPTNEYACAKCGFLLKGLPDEGLCPECGHGYTRATALRLLEPPRVSDLLSYLAVPLAIPCALFVIGAVPFFAAGDSVGVCLLVLGLLALAPCTIWLGRRFIALERGLRACVAPQHDPSRDRRPTAVALGTIGNLLIGAGWTFTVLTVLVGGACLAMVLVKLR